MSRVSLVRGDDRYSNVKIALELIEDEIAEKVRTARSIVIKPNFVTIFRQLAATHVDAVRAVLDVILKFTDESDQLPITIAEGAALGSSSLGFMRYGYYRLRRKYPVRFVDLNKDDFCETDIYDAQLKPFKVKVAKTIVESDFRISTALLKTHDTVVATLSLKNMLVGSLRGTKVKQSIHQSYPATNKSLSKLARFIPPHLSVIDGFKGMEGQGPVDGNPVDMKVALAGTDFLAVDTVGAYLMGFDIEDIGYLHYCNEAELGEGNFSKIKIEGNISAAECRRKFKPHISYSDQLEWHF